MSVYERVPETDPNEALESLNSYSNEEIVGRWLEQEGISSSPLEFTDAASSPGGKSIVIPRFFGARTIEQEIMRTTMTALDAASREIYGEGFDLKVAEWDEGYSPQHPGNRILVEPSVVVSEEKKREMGLDSDMEKRLDRLDVRQLGDKSYVLDFNTIADAERGQSMKEIEFNEQYGEPCMLSRALNAPQDQKDTPYEQLSGSFELPRASRDFGSNQREVLEHLFESEVYPDNLQIKDDGSIEQLKRVGNSYIRSDTGEKVSEDVILDKGLMEASGSYSFVIGPQHLDGTNCIWNGGWPDVPKFRSDHSRDLLKKAEEHCSPVRIPSLGHLADAMPYKLEEAALSSNYSTCAQNPYQRDEAKTSLLLSKEVLTGDLAGEYAADIARADRQEDYTAMSIPEFSQKVMNRIAHTYGV